MNVIVKRKDVAKLAGVSEATVSRVFNNVKPLREETKKKVLKAAATLNYHPNALAQSFARGKSGNIGVIVPVLPKVRMFSTYYFSEILSGIGMKLAEMDYGLLLQFSSPDKPIDYVKLFRSHIMDGCIILGSHNIPEEYVIEQLHKVKCFPDRLVNQNYEGYDFHTVDGQHHEGSYEAVSYLVKQGHQRIAFVNGPLEYSNSVERLQGYETALRDYGIRLNLDWVFTGNYSRTSGFAIAEEIGPIIGSIDAVFVANDRMAIGLMQGLSEQGYEAGRDYSLIGYDDSDITSMTNPQLSSVRVPLFEMGKRAAEAVFHLISDNQKEVCINERLFVKFIARDSIIHHSNGRG